MQTNYVPAEKISLARLSSYDEKWVEDIIKHESSSQLLGLGILKNFKAQVTHQHAGRLDLVADNELGERFVIELMVGELDASHLTRVMEYWLRQKQQGGDSEVEWVAVIIAENIQKSRYFALLQFLGEKLRNDLPLIAIEMTALKVGDATKLHFATVVDSRVQQVESPKISPPSTRETWRASSSETSIRIVDELGVLLKEIDTDLTQRFTTSYIGTVLGVRPHNFLVLRPRKNFVRVRVKISDPESWAEKLAAAGCQVLLAANHKIQFSLREEDVSRARDLLKTLLKAGFDEKRGSDDEESDV